MIPAGGSETAVKTILVGSAATGRCSLLDMLLISQGFEVVQRHDGQGVLKFLQTETPDAVVLDIDLPGADGRDICSRVRSIKRLANTIVVLITPSLLELGGAENLREMVRSTSADLVLPEPIGDKNIAGRLQNEFLKRQKTAVGESVSARVAGGEQLGQTSRATVAEREAMTVAVLEDEVRVLRGQLKAYQRQGRRLSSAVTPEGTAATAERERMIAELNERNERLLRDLEYQRAAQASATHEVEQLRSLLTERQSMVENHQRRNDVLLKEVEQFKFREADMREALSMSQAAVVEREEEISSLKQQVGELAGELNKRTAYAAATGKKLDAALAKVSVREQEIVGLERRNAKLLQELEARKAEEAPLREFFQRILLAEQRSDHHRTNVNA